MDRPLIKHSAAADEYWFDEGCFILELSNDSNDPAVSVARARVRPGATTKWHSLRGITERYVINSGRGSVEIGELPPASVTSGDTVIIPPGCRQRITNTGSEDLVFLAICTPRFTNEAYTPLE